MAATGQVKSTGDQLLELAEQKAKELQMKRDGYSYGLTSTQMQGLIWAMGEMLDRYDEFLTKAILETFKRYLEAVKGY